jgi:predicted alpha/beta hydrolase family esterase
MDKPKKPILNLFLLTAVSFGLLACETHSTRIQNANTYIPKHNLQSQHDLNTIIPIHYKTIKHADPQTNLATIYIEGDGFAYITKSRPSNNPTPKTPVALMMASNDSQSDSIYYIARPCQYVQGDLFNQKCDKKYWTTHRYAPDIIKSFDQALNKIKADTNIKYFDLVGFSGGANIAGLLSVQRNDIHSIRTVAGNVDNDYFTSFHNVSPMPYSLNMANYVSQLSQIPQIHFVSNNDEFVPFNINQSYTSKLPNQKCSQTIRVSKTTHLDGWFEQWPTLFKINPVCK